MIYVGENDWICNWVGNEKWVLGLNWSGSEAMKNSEIREWEGGRVRSFGGLTFATVEGAGHMVRQVVNSKLKQSHNGDFVIGSL